MFVLGTNDNENEGGIRAAGRGSKGYVAIFMIWYVNLQHAEMTNFIAQGRQIAVPVEYFAFGIAISLVFLSFFADASMSLELVNNAL